MNSYCQTLSRTYSNILNLQQMLQSKQNLSTPQAHFLCAIDEILTHIREQLYIHKDYCCTCELSFTNIDSSSDDEDYEDSIP
jgi:hypothetical protein